MRNRIPLHAILALLALASGACDASDPVEPEPEQPPVVTDSLASISSCEGCHRDYTALKRLHTPDSIIPSGGCSGPPPYVEPYDRVYLSAEGFATFKGTRHGQMSCTQCHGGVDRTPDKKLAHSGNFVKQPSFQAITVCEGCHKEEVSGVRNSLHFNGWGQKLSQIQRAGVQQFSQLHPGIQKGYQENCATCHASCGSCHVNRPPASGGGLMNGHAFDAPTMRDNCTACHSSRGGHAYYGVGTGTKPDVHLTKARFDCMDCHTTAEMHATSGKVYPLRYAVEELPDCKDCHRTAAAVNPYHTTHWEDFNCHVCHSQDYNTCGSCHVAGEGARIHSHQSFKIGLNPLASPDRPYKFSTVRRTLAAPDTWERFGVPQLPSFNAKPIYNYTTPHNIQRWTSRTEFQGPGACYAQCHVIYEAGSYKNRHLYLFSSDFLTEWERNAAKSVVVDGKLPRKWGTP